MFTSILIYCMLGYMFTFLHKVIVQTLDFEFFGENTYFLRSLRQKRGFYQISVYVYPFIASKPTDPISNQFATNIRILGQYIFTRYNFEIFLKLGLFLIFYKKPLLVCLNE